MWVLHARAGSCANPYVDEIKKLLGEGTFGKVFQAYDRTEKTPCAIKVIRSVPEHRDAVRNELEVLQTLASNDKHNTNQCIHLRDSFHFRNHTCIVTDLYGKSMFDFRESNSFAPFPASHIQEFGRQLFTSVAFLHDLRVVHADLKPENILLVNDDYKTFPYDGTAQPSSATADCSVTTRKVLRDTEIRLIDFGSAFRYDSHDPDTFTHQFRSPEHILKVDWGFPHDVWSVGCILVELWTGECLFQTEDDLVHLAMMETMWGKELDKELIGQCSADSQVIPNRLVHSPTHR
jgi:dual-specificity kinase